MRTRTVDLNGPTNVADFGGEGTPIVLVHGLGGSVTNWIEVGPRLAHHGRVVAVDLPGFGRTPPAGRSSHVDELQEVLDQFIVTEIGEPVILVGNSLGGLVSMLEAWRSPANVERLILVNPAAPAPTGALAVDPFMVFMAATVFVRPLCRAVLRGVDRRTTPSERVGESFDLVAGDPTRISPAAKRAHVAINAERRHQPWAYDAFQQAYSSVLTRMVPPRYDPMAKAIAAPTLLMHGDVDRVVPLKAAQRLARMRPDWAFHTFDGVGHVPMLEVPDDFIDVAAPFLSGAALSAHD